MSYDYDLIVVGGGSAGLTASGVAANLGARTLMIERRRLGGDCTWTGCIPSKTLLRSAQVAHQMRHASRYGLSDREPIIDFAALMDHVREIRQEVYEDADRPELYEAMGAEVRRGTAAFVDAHTIEVTDGDRTRRVTGRYFVVCTGARAFIPPIEGLASMHEGGSRIEDVDPASPPPTGNGVPAGGDGRRMNPTEVAVRYHTNETLFEIDAMPARLAILGAGPIGTEMAQAFRRLGSEVKVLERTDRILPREDEELAWILQNELATEGIDFHLGTTVRRVSTVGDEVVLKPADGGAVVRADALLVAVGRRANVESLNLEAAGVAYGADGIVVDDRCRTNVRHVYAAGDVTGRYHHTHMSEHMAKVAVSNALLKFPMKIDRRHVPHVTFTDPEFAHVGASEAELKARGVSYEVYRFPYSKIDRAVTDGNARGLIKVYARSWNGKILGADVLGSHAGELISEYAVAMRNGVTLRRIADTIHPYPTYGLGARRAADQWYVRKRSPVLVRLLQKLFRFRGRVVEYGPDEIL